MREASFRRFAPSSPGSGAKGGAPGEMNKEAAVVMRISKPAATLLITDSVINNRNMNKSSRFSRQLAPNEQGSGNGELRSRGGRWQFHPCGRCQRDVEGGGLPTCERP